MTSDDGIISPLQCLLSQEVLFSPNGAQLTEYEKKCHDAHCLNPQLCPKSHSGGKTHGKIQKCLARVVQDETQQLLMCGTVRSIGLVQDRFG
jgi:hypothetical protein